MVQAFSRDVSVVGAFLKTDRLTGVGTHLKTEFHLPGQSRSIQCGAIVRAVVPATCDAGSAGLGIEFEGISDEDLGRLDTLLSKGQGRGSLFRSFLSRF